MEGGGGGGREKKRDGELDHLSVLGWAVLFSCPVFGRYGSCFRALAVILVSDLFLFLNPSKQSKGAK